MRVPELTDNTQKSHEQQKHFSIRLLLMLFSALVLSLPSLSATAADRAIVVFDASGSMWGQVEGKSKIAIAKQTLGELVTNWDDSKELGLMAYGHRRKGDCKDIETLVPVGKINRAGLVSAVNNINPKGKTPISASLTQAAEELKFTEDNATVILISDGKETCHADPCETAAQLEKLGVNFTAHVIGFDVDTETGKQLECIAANTGGRYFPAGNAKELNDALKQVVEEPSKITLKAIDEATGNTLHKTIDWKIIHSESEEVIALTGPGSGSHLLIETENPPEQTETGSQMIKPGTWLVSATAGIYAGESRVAISADKDQLIQVSLKKTLPKIILNAAGEALTGTGLDLSWQLPDRDMEGKIVLQAVDEKATFHAPIYLYTQKKNEGVLRLPTPPGDYILRFYDVRERKTALHEQALTLKPAEITLNAAESAGTGTELALDWIAPKDVEAKITLQQKDEKPAFHANPYLYTQKKQQGTLRLPVEPGEYVLRWLNVSDRKVALEKPITLTETSITIKSPDEAQTGTELDIAWDAPKTSDAKINLQLADEKPAYHANPYLYTKNNSEGTLRLPSVTGEYVLRWYNLSDRKIVTEKPLKLVESAISINAPDEAASATELDISWNAPKTSNARINLQLADEKPAFNSSPYLYTKNKTAGTLRLPSTAGDYMLRWYNLSDRNIVAEKPIRLVESTITFDAPEEAGAGSEIDIVWNAPKSTNARLNLQLADEKPQFSTPVYVYTRNKTGASMRLPSEPGEYVLRWYNLSDRKIITQRPIRLSAQQISIMAPDTALAGSEIEISWDAPKGLDAFINIQPADEKPRSNASPYLSIKKKSADYLRLPSTAGDYKLRWFNRKDRKVVAEKPITLTQPEIVIKAPEEALAGTEIELSWQAPKGLDSFINLQMADEKPNYNAPIYLSTRKASSAYMALPSTPGDYMLRWYNRNDRKHLAETTLKLKDPGITINAPDEAEAGSEMEFAWQAPKNTNAFVNIQPAGEKPNYNAPHYASTVKKSSYYIALPDQPGDYVMRWWNRTDAKVMASKPIKLTPAGQ